MEVTSKFRPQHYSFVALFLLHCVFSSSAYAAFKTEDYFPLELNPEFTYQINGDPNNTEVITVPYGTIWVNSALTKRVNYSDGSSDYYTNDSNGLIFHRFTILGTAVGDLDIVINPPAKLAEANMVLGQTVLDNKPATAGPFSANFSSNTLVNAVNEIVSVSTGTYSTVRITVTYTLSGGDLSGSITTSNRYWLAEHLGPVKIENLISGEVLELISVDSDGDGIINANDPNDDNDSEPDSTDAFPLDPDETSDLDNDGIGDNEDDSDNDTFTDAVDNCPLNSNPDQTDTDNDNEGDACDIDDDNDGIQDTSDNCPLVSNPDQANNDGDSEGDVCDLDDDNDGTPDLNDTFPFDSSESVDSDNDGVGDNADDFPNDPTETTDTDSDSVGDNSDNCIGDANPSQTDTDGDTEGDACDADDDGDGIDDIYDSFPLDGTESADNDNDGIGNSTDNCPNVPNPGQEDIIGVIGIGDACEPEVFNDPQVIINTTLELVQGETANIDIAHLTGINLKGGAADLVFTLTTALKYGQLEFNDISGAAITSFTQADINTNRVVYIHNGTTPPAISSFQTTMELSIFGISDGVVFSGIAEDDESGHSISNAGDVNGDGHADFIIGANLADPNGILSAGQTYVVFGTDAGFPNIFKLETLNGVNGFILNGHLENDQSGFSVSTAGDINDDGFDDIIIGSPNADVNGVPNAGKSYVVYGKATPFSATPIELSTLNGTNGFVINGISENSNSGHSVSVTGDINNDGVDDIIIGAPFDNAVTGQSYVVFGKPNGSPIGFPQNLNLSELNGTDGFIINGTGTYTSTGASVSTSGDINGDGIDDLLIGAYQALNQAGQTYVIYGKNTNFNSAFSLLTLDGTNGFKLNGINNIDFSGFNVSFAGDINGDGIDDIIIGAPNANSFDGSSYVVFGRRAVSGQLTYPEDFSLSSLDGTNGFTINGTEGSGRTVSAAGDINGDGIDDLLIGNPFKDVIVTAGNNSYPVLNKGQSYVVYGKSSAFSSSLDLATLDGINGFTLNGHNEYDFTGRSISAAGDVNSDGIDDFIVGANGANPLNSSNTNLLYEAGATYLILGKASFTDIFKFNLSDGTDSIVQQFNISVSLGIDTDGDGISDNVDLFPNDPNETIDTDGDGVGDNSDAFPNEPTESSDTDGDGIGDNADTVFNINNGDVSTLIAAINAANDAVDNPGLDLIELATNGSYQLNAIDNTDNGNTGLPTITSEIIINGNRATINGGPDNNPCNGSGIEFRIFLVIGANSSLTLNNTTVSNGCNFGTDGGGITVIDGKLNLNNSAVIGNAAQSSEGVYSDSGSVTISR